MGGDRRSATNSFTAWQDKQRIPAVIPALLLELRDR